MGGLYKDQDGRRVTLELTAYPAVTLTEADSGALDSMCPGKTFNDGTNGQMPAEGSLEGAIAQAATFTYLSPDPQFPFPLSDYIDFDTAADPHGLKPVSVVFTGTGLQTARLSCLVSDGADGTTFISVAVMLSPEATPNNPDSKIKCPSEVWFADVLANASLPVAPDDAVNMNSDLTEPGGWEFDVDRSKAPWSQRCQTS